MGAVFTKTYREPQIDRAEVMRYVGMPANALLALVDECEAELGPVIGKVSYVRVPVAVDGDGVDLGFAAVSSRDLAARLENCGEAVVFAATAGSVFDRMIAKYSRVSPAKALVFQALGTEYAEKICDLFSADGATEAAERGLRPARRFSPGFGDLALDLQRDIFKTIDPLRIGLTLNDSLIMSPSKSVTAIIGLIKAE